MASFPQATKIPPASAAQQALDLTLLLGLEAGRDMGAGCPCYILSGLSTGQSYSEHGRKGTKAGQSQLVGQPGQQSRLQLASQVL